jgi:hypothetical protein
MLRSWPVPTRCLVEHFVGKPLEVKLARIDRWWLIYVALASGTLVTWFAGLNIFGALMPDVLGRIPMGAIVGGGSQMLHKIIKAAGDLVTKWAAPYRQAGRAHKATAGRHSLGRPVLLVPW